MIIKKKKEKKIIICLIYPKKTQKSRTQPNVTLGHQIPFVSNKNYRIWGPGGAAAAGHLSSALTSPSPPPTPVTGQSRHGRMPAATRGRPWVLRPSMRTRVPGTSAFPSSFCPFFLPSWFRRTVCNHFPPRPCHLLVRGTEPTASWLGDVPLQPGKRAAWNHGSVLTVSLWSQRCSKSPGVSAGMKGVFRGENDHKPPRGMSWGFLG